MRIIELTISYYRDNVSHKIINNRILNSTDTRTIEQIVEEEKNFYKSYPVYKDLVITGREIIKGD